MVLSKEEREALERKIRMKMRERLKGNVNTSGLPWISQQPESKQKSSEEQDSSEISPEIEELKNEVEKLRKENEELKKRVAEAEAESESKDSEKLSQILELLKKGTTTDESLLTELNVLREKLEEYERDKNFLMQQVETLSITLKNLTDSLKNTKEEKEEEETKKEQKVKKKRWWILWR
jgi:chromosome segregation ATPase